MPLEIKEYVDPKAVQKWILASSLTGSSDMSSTADDHPDNLVISLEQEITDETSECFILSKFSGFLGLEKKKEKVKRRKQVIEVGS